MEIKQDTGKPNPEDRRLARGRPEAVGPPREPGLADLVKRVGDDFGALATHHIELARNELGNGLRRAAADAAAVILGGVVGLIGLAILCLSAVAAAEPMAPALWLRLLLGALLYLALGAAIVYAFVRRLRGDQPLGFAKTRQEMKRTADVLKEQVQDG